jgi:glycosyltransferase involved in cell wall biosynthesis
VTATLHALVKADRFDVLIASSPPYFPLPAGLLLHWLWDTPLVLELRDLWPEYLVEMGVLRSRAAERAVLAIDRAILARAAHLVTVTEPLRRRLVEKGMPADRVTVISNGVDPNSIIRSRKRLPRRLSPPGTVLCWWVTWGISAPDRASPWCSTRLRGSRRRASRCDS